MQWEEVPLVRSLPDLLLMNANFSVWATSRKVCLVSSRISAAASVLVSISLYYLFPQIKADEIFNDFSQISIIVLLCDFKWFSCLLTDMDPVINASSINCFPSKLPYFVFIKFFRSLKSLGVIATSIFLSEQRIFVEFYPYNEMDLYRWCNKSNCFLLCQLQSWLVEWFKWSGLSNDELLTTQPL